MIINDEPGGGRQEKEGKRKDKEEEEKKVEGEEERGIKERWTPNKNVQP